MKRGRNENEICEKVEAARKRAENVSIKGITDILDKIENDMDNWLEELARGKDYVTIEFDRQPEYPVRTDDLHDRLYEIWKPRGIDVRVPKIGPKIYITIQFEK